jgi:hypothetical protein
MSGRAMSASMSRFVLTRPLPVTSSQSSDSRSLTRCVSRCAMAWFSSRSRLRRRGPSSVAAPHSSAHASTSAAPRRQALIIGFFDQGTGPF